jgi:hypothetical protein
MATSDLDLLSLLTTHPTFTVDEAVRLLAARVEAKRRPQVQPERPIRPKARGVVARVLLIHASAPSLWSN